MKKRAKRSTVVLILLAMCVFFVGCCDKQYVEVIQETTELTETTETVVETADVETVVETADVETEVETADVETEVETADVETEVETVDVETVVETVETTLDVWVLPNESDERKGRIQIYLNVLQQTEDSETFVDTLKTMYQGVTNFTYDIDTLEDEFLQTRMGYCCETITGNWVIITGVDKPNNLVYYLTESGEESYSTPEEVFPASIDVIFILF